MTWSPKYIQDSLYYEPWKTKFIEVFSREYPLLKSLYVRLDKNDVAAFEEFIAYYISIYKTVLKILKNKLKSLGNTNVIFYRDVLFEASREGLIADLQTWFEVIEFVKMFERDNKNCKLFKQKYIEIFEVFRENIKSCVATGGNRDEDFVFYDNSAYLWGIDVVYYKRIIKFFVSREKLKIVRICGSRVMNNFRPFSDIDLIFEGTYSKKEFVEICNALYDLNCPYIFDVNDIRKPNKPFIYRNTVKSNIFYQRSDYFADDYVSILNR